MRIRLATPADAPVLAEMRWDFTAEYNASLNPDERDSFIAECSRWIEAALTSARWQVWVAVTDAGEIVSHIFIQAVERVPRPGRIEVPWGYVTNVYTRPKQRGLGIGGELLRAAQRWAREQHYELLLLWPSSQSVPFYSRHGFQRPAEALEQYLD